MSIFPDYLAINLTVQDPRDKKRNTLNFRIQFPEVYYKMATRIDGNITTATIYHPHRDDFLRAIQTRKLVNEREVITISMNGFMLTANVIRIEIEDIMYSAFNLENTKIECPLWVAPAHIKELEAVIPNINASPTSFINYVLHLMEYEYPKYWIPLRKKTEASPTTTTMSQKLKTAMERNRAVK